MLPVCVQVLVMNPRLLELREQRGALRARCAAQRHALAVHGEALKRVCSVADRLRAGLHWVRQNPAVVGVAATALVLMKPSRAWRWGRRALWAWQGWRALRQRIHSL